MKKADMIAVIARQTASAWADVMEYELDLHIRNFKSDEISYTGFSKYCESEQGHIARTAIWYGLDNLCESLNIDYANMEKTDKVIKKHNNRAFQANDKLISRMKPHEQKKV